MDAWADKWSGTWQIKDPWAKAISRLKQMLLKMLICLCWTPIHILLNYFTSWPTMQTAHTVLYKNVFFSAHPVYTAMEHKVKGSHMAGKLWCFTFATSQFPALFGNEQKWNFKRHYCQNGHVCLHQINVLIKKVSMQHCNPLTMQKRPWFCIL